MGSARQASWGRHGPPAPRVVAPWHFAEPVKVAQLGRRAALARRHGEGVWEVSPPLSGSLAGVTLLNSRPAAGRRGKQLGHATQGWACIHQAGCVLEGRETLLGRHVTAASTSERLDNARARQPCSRPGVSAQRRRRLDRCVAAGPFAALLTFCRTPCPDARARLSQCSQPQSAGRTAPRRPGKQSVRGAGVSRTVAAGAAATPPVTLGSKIPDVELSYFDSEHQLQRLSTKDLCSGKKARRLTVPGCSRPPLQATRNRGGSH